MAEEADDSYELMPQKEIVEIRKELDRLKKNPLGENTNTDTLLDALRDLSHTMKDLHQLFSTAAKDLKEEEVQLQPEQKLHDESLAKKIDTLIEQNKKIAQGIVTVAEMLKELKERKDEASLMKRYSMPRRPAMMSPPPPPIPSPPPSRQERQPQPTWQPPKDQSNDVTGLFETPPVVPPLTEAPIPTGFDDPRKKTLFGRLRK